MNQPPANDAPNEVTGMPAAVRIGAALVAAFALITVLALIDREARPRLEAVQELGRPVRPQAPK